MNLTDFEGYHGILSDFKGVYWDFKAYQVYQLYQEVQVILWNITQNNYTRYIGHFKGSQKNSMDFKVFNGIQETSSNFKHFLVISRDFKRFQGILRDFNVFQDI